MGWSRVSVAFSDLSLTARCLQSLDLNYRAGSCSIKQCIESYQV